MNPIYNNILEFLGRTPRQFLSHQFYHGILLITAIVAVLSGFYVTMFLIQSLWAFVGWLVLVVVVLIIAKRSLLRKNLVKLGFGYLVFWEDCGEGERATAPYSPAAAGELVRSLTIRWRDMGTGPPSLKVLVPLAVVYLAHPNLPQLNGQTVRGFKSLLRRVRLLEAVVFACILIPFLLLALLFSAPLGVGMMMLVAMIAFLFAYFLFSAIFQPFLLLRLQSEMAALLNPRVPES